MNRLHFVHSFIYQWMLGLLAYYYESFPGLKAFDLDSYSSCPASQDARQFETCGKCGIHFETERDLNSNSMSQQL